jgi:long-chain acyl-CoA synthetase
MTGLDRRPGIPGVLDVALEQRPDSVAVVARSGELTYAQLDAAADQAAGALWGLGVRPGERLAVCLPNDLDVVVAFHAAMRIGALWVGIGEALVPAEKEHLLRDCSASVLLADEAVFAPLPLDRSFRPVAVQQWRGACADAGKAPAVETQIHAPAGIAYTSGTTGLPKGIVHSQHNLLLPGEVLVASRGWGPALRKGDCLPLTILNMMVLTTLLTAQAGGCCVVMDRRDPDGILEWLTATGITHWNGVPAQLYDLARREDLPRLPALQEIWSGGGDCPEQLRDAFSKAFGVAVRATYGLTEAPTVVAIDPVGSDHRLGASGRVLPHLSVRSCGDDGAPVPDGRTGELVLSAIAHGPWAGRWTPPLGTWRYGEVHDAPGPELRTGDLGTVDDDGFLTVVDRRKLVIVRGGANVYPAEVERVLLSQAGVAGAAVFGIPDERLGERVGALVELVPDSPITINALRDVCTAQLSRYKVPEQWGLLASLPRNAMGKVVRTELPALLGQALDNATPPGGDRP